MLTDGLLGPTREEELELLVPLAHKPWAGMQAVWVRAGTQVVRVSGQTAAWETDARWTAAQETGPLNLMQAMAGV